MSRLILHKHGLVVDKNAGSWRTTGDDASSRFSRLADATKPELILCLPALRYTITMGINSQTLGEMLPPPRFSLQRDVMRRAPADGLDAGAERPWASSKVPTASIRHSLRLVKSSLPPAIVDGFTAYQGWIEEASRTASAPSIGQLARGGGGRRALSRFPPLSKL